MVTNISKYTVGADPELWITSKLTGKPTPIIGLLGGTKDRPIEFLPGFAYQEDNCSAEFNIPPVTTKLGLIENIRIALEELEKVLSDYNLLITPSVEFHPDQLKSKASVVIGCSRDFNAYTKEVDTVPNLKKTCRRFAGGHIHIGYEDSTWKDQALLVKFCDMFLNIPSILLDRDPYRKTHYGNPGRFRVKEYGVEYRPLSNYWIADEALTGFVWDQIEKAINGFNTFGEAIEELEGRIVTVATSHDEDLAKEFIKEFKICDLNEIEALQRKVVTIPVKPEHEEAIS